MNKILLVAFTILGIFFYGCELKEDEIFNKGMDFFNKGNLIEAHKEFSKIPKESPIYERTKMYLIISQNEQKLSRISKKYIKSDKASLHTLPMKKAPIKTVLTKNTELDLYYVYDSWSRIYRKGKDNWIMPDIPELNGWIHSSQLEDEIQYFKRIKEKNIIEEQIRQEKEAERLKKYTVWETQYLLNTPEIVQNIELMWVESYMISIKLNVVSLNKIMIENVGIDVAYNLRKYYGEKMNIQILINVGYSEVAEISWSIWNERFECKFKK